MECRKRQRKPRAKRGGKGRERKEKCEKRGASIKYIKKEYN